MPLSEAIVMGSAGRCGAGHIFYSQRDRVYVVDAVMQSSSAVYLGDGRS